MRKLWQQKVAAPLLAFLSQGVTPVKLALSVSISVGIGVFPILGTHSMLTVAVIFLGRLNPAAVVLVTNVVFPLFFFTIIPFVRVGEWMVQAAPFPLDISYWINKISSTGIEVLFDRGYTVLHALLGWLAVCVPVCVVLYYILFKLFHHYTQTSKHI